MPQAEKSNSTNLSRRSALAGLAGAAAASAINPTLATTAIAIAGDDAELLALKAKFDPLFATWVEMNQAWEKLIDDAEDDSDAWDKLLAELTTLASDILSYNANTVEGLRLQLRALISASTYYEAWNSASIDEEEEPEYPWTHNFIESAAGVLGVPFPPY
jgi:hypothetical protein